MAQRIDIPTPEDIQKLDGASARGLLRQLAALIATLYALIDDLRETIARQSHQLEQFQRAMFGSSSERLPSLKTQLRKKQARQETAEQKKERLRRAQKRREKNAEKKRKAARKEVVEHPIVEPNCHGCGRHSHQASPLADAVSYEYEYVPAHFVRREHRQHRAVCECGEFLYGQTPQRVCEGGMYGPGLHANVVVSKCADSLPIERQAKRLRRVGIPMNKSTLLDLYHRTAWLLRPLWAYLVDDVAQSADVSADETPIRVQAKGKCRRGWMWTFIAGKKISYVYSPSRGGETPVQVLGGTTGTLQVDGYTGNNKVTCPSGRERAGCWAHVRRKFFEARSTAPVEADHMMSQILELYGVEYLAADEPVIGSKTHLLLTLRQTKSTKIIDGIFEWLDAQKPLHPPKSPLGRAINYTLKQRDALSVFLDNPKVSLDNNLSERNLRLIALGRKNFLFVGNDQAGENLAILQSLVATCIANDVNPQDYLADVLMRIQDHPQSAIAELMPYNWEPQD